MISIYLIYIKIKIKMTIIKKKYLKFLIILTFTCSFIILKVYKQKIN